MSRTLLTEAQGYELLKTYRIPIPKYVAIQSAGEALPCCTGDRVPGGHESNFAAGHSQKRSRWCYNGNFHNGGCNPGV